MVFVPSVQVGHKGHFMFSLLPTLDDHIFRVRTPFRVFLDSMESALSQRLFPYACGRQWVSTTLLKIYVLHQVCRLFGCVDVNSRVLT